jgi:hypothetical protein
MKFLKSHTDYLCGYKDQIVKAHRFFTLNKDKELYDKLVLDIDVIYAKAKVRLAGEDLTDTSKREINLGVLLENWHGSLKDYIIKSKDYDIEYMILNFKDTTEVCHDNVMKILKWYPKIIFLCSGYQYPLTLENTIDYSQFEVQHIFDERDFF